MLEILALIATILGGLVGLIQLARWVVKPNAAGVIKSVRPVIDIDIDYVHGGSLPLGISSKAKPVDGYFERDETLHVFEKYRHIKVVLVNNSEQTAYYPKIYLHSLSFKPALDELNAIVPIQSNQRVEVNGKFKAIEEAIPRERSDIHNFPSLEMRRNLKILIEYQDAGRSTYFSLFDGAKSGTQYLESRPNGFDI